MQIRQAKKNDAEVLASLALLKGAGTSAYFWQQGETRDRSALEIGATRFIEANDGFSWRNVRVGIINNCIAGMVMAYGLPADYNEKFSTELPEFFRPLEELKTRAAGSFYIDMLATFPQYRNRSVATQLMVMVEQWASAAGYSQTSLQVFEKNASALNLYLQLGYQEHLRRKVVAHPSLVYGGDVLLLTRPILATREVD